jgi:nucleoside-diphosphate-sugar epimerase
MGLEGRRVLISGANGFIGRALAERMLQSGARVRGLVRSRAKVEGVGDIEIALGDVSDLESVRAAVQSCDLIVHCAAMQGRVGTLDEFRRVNVGGTLNVIRAAQEARVKRMIHISTVNVHGFPPPQNASVDSPLCFSGDFYSVSKAEGERVAWQFAREHGMELTVIRPGCTYGPRSEAWTLRPLRRVRHGTPVLIGRGDGICNAVYIDNLIDLIVLAAGSPAAVGEAFIGAEGRGVTWRAFYGAYARMAGVTRLHSIPRGLALGVAAFSQVLGRVTGHSAPVARASVDFYSHHVVYDIRKAQTLLGYAPRVDFAEGMRRTEAWLLDNGYLKKASKDVRLDG